MSIKPKELSGIIFGELSTYRQDITDGMKQDIKQTTKECVKTLRRKAPARTGRYAKGWRVKTAFESAEDIRLQVYNKTDYQLTHLLEHGHVIAGGGRTVGAKPHIGPAEAEAARKLGKRVKVRVGRA